MENKDWKDLTEEEIQEWEIEKQKEMIREVESAEADEREYNNEN